jgi:hypothetical protein
MGDTPLHENRGVLLGMYDSRAFSRDAIAAFPELMHDLEPSAGLLHAQRQPSAQFRQPAMEALHWQAQPGPQQLLKRQDGMVADTRDPCGSVALLFWFVTLV